MVKYPSLLAPLYNYCGPFNKLKNGKARNALDRLCKRHDQDYQTIIDAGGDPYWTFNWADRRFLKDVKLLIKSPEYKFTYGSYDQGIVRSVVGAFTAKKTFLKENPKPAPSNKRKEQMITDYAPWKKRKFRENQLLAKRKMTPMPRTNIFKRVAAEDSTGNPYAVAIYEEKEASGDHLEKSPALLTAMNGGKYRSRRSPGAPVGASKKRKREASEKPSLSAKRIRSLINRAIAEQWGPMNDYREENSGAIQAATDQSAVAEALFFNSSYCEALVNKAAVVDVTAATPGDDITTLSNLSALNNTKLRFNSLINYTFRNNYTNALKLTVFRFKCMKGTDNAPSVNYQEYLDNKYRSAVTHETSTLYNNYAAGQGGYWKLVGKSYHHLESANQISVNWKIRGKYSTDQHDTHAFTYEKGSAYCMLFLVEGCPIHEDGVAAEVAQSSAILDWKLRRYDRFQIGCSLRVPTWSKTSYTDAIAAEEVMQIGTGGLANDPTSAG